jgi:hypothetical protein
MTLLPLSEGGKLRISKKSLSFALDEDDPLDDDDDDDDALEGAVM